MTASTPLPLPTHLPWRLRAQRWSQSALAWVLPEQCRQCAAPGSALCTDCLADWPTVHHEHCSFCALPLNPAGDCPVCSVSAPNWDTAWIPFVYASPVSDAILAWKFAERLDWTAPLANAWLERVGLPDLPDLLLPVPLHRARLRERGYNQAALLARYWGRHFGVPVGRQLRRDRNTPHQVGAAQDQRRQNLYQAFSVRGAIPAHVALVDDVLTTGSTLGEISRLLKAQGVARVDLWVLARAL